MSLMEKGDSRRHRDQMDVAIPAWRLAFCGAGCHPIQCIAKRLTEIKSVCVGGEDLTSVDQTTTPTIYVYV